MAGTTRRNDAAMIVKNATIVDPDARAQPVAVPRRGEGERGEDHGADQEPSTEVAQRNPEPDPRLLPSPVAERPAATGSSTRSIARHPAGGTARGPRAHSIRP